jgi:hypothetical protein
MNLSEFNDKQKSLLVKLKSSFNDDTLFEKWLSMPNKHFRNKPPIFFILSENYDYFQRFINNSTIE